MGRVFQRLFHQAVIEVFILLPAQRLHRRALAAVEHTHLQKRLVRIHAHFAAQRVDLAHEMPFRRAADRGVARHKGDAVEIEGEHRRFQTRAGEGEGGFAARVPRADHHGVVLSFAVNVHFYFFKIIFLRSLTCTAIL